MKTELTLAALSLALGAVFAPTAGAQEVLPFPPTPSASTPGLTMQDSTYKKRVEPKRLADGVPNILIILMDDIGPATAATYGGEINTPTLDRIAKMGIHKAQLLSDMKLLDIPVGLLINFHEMKLTDGVHRMILPGANR